MKVWKKVVALLLAATMMVPLALAAPVAQDPLTDVEGHWAQKEIEQAVADGWVDGYPDDTFQPEKDHHPGRVHQDDTGRDPFDSRLRDGRVDGGHRQKREKGITERLRMNPA